MADEETASGGGLISGPFRSDRLVFDVLTNCVADRAIVESFFHDLKISDESPNARYRLTREQDSGPDAAVLVEGPRVDPFSTHDLADALTRLVAGLSIATLDASPSNLHLHAAAAAKGGRSVIIAASRNTGKSTSVSHLLHRGYGFITDEMVVLSRKDDLVRGVPRPISIKPMGLPQTGYSGAQTMLGETEDPTSQCFVTPGSIGTEIIEAEAPHVVVLLRRPGGERAQGPRPLHPADAVVALMQETLDADRFGPDTALRLAQLASRCHCIELERGTPTEVADAIDGLLSLAPPVGMVVRAYPPSQASGDDVVTVGLGDRCVVHHRRSGKILALDAAGTRVWETAGGWRAHPEVQLDGPVIASFVGQLRSHGLLRSGDGR